MESERQDATHRVNDAEVSWCGGKTLCTGGRCAELVVGAMSITRMSHGTPPRCPRMPYMVRMLDLPYQRHAVPILSVGSPLSPVLMAVWLRQGCGSRRPRYKPCGNAWTSRITPSGAFLHEIVTGMCILKDVINGVVPVTSQPWDGW